MTLCNNEVKNPAGEDVDDNDGQHDNGTTTIHSQTANITFSATGSAAHTRLVPLLPRNWKDVTYELAAAAATATAVKAVGKQPQQQQSTHEQQQRQPPSRIVVPHFLWENAPRHETKAVRDDTKCYSHLPNGTDILDSKWVLARLLTPPPKEEPRNSSSCCYNQNPFLAVLETHSFRGRTGFEELCHRLDWTTTITHDGNSRCKPAFRDLYDRKTQQQQQHDEQQQISSSKQETSTTPLSSNNPFPPRPNLWVIKDAGSNGAGGVWVVGPSNTQEFSSSSHSSSSPLIEGHRYVAQQYAWPPVLYENRKCHVRVYAFLTSDGRAFVHRRAFLHVANDEFVVEGEQEQETTTTTTLKEDHYKTCVHITNCCANSHDKVKFAGEICADLQATEWNTIPMKRSNNNNNSTEEGTGGGQQTTTVDVVPIADFAPSIHASVAALAQRAFPFLQGGQANHGFEYLGIDFILSHKTATSNTGEEIIIPVAYLLEVNAPPSQDTATGLSHAEELHDTVIRDLLHLWVLPNVVPDTKEVTGGWQCVYQHLSSSSSSSSIEAAAATAALDVVVAVSDDHQKVPIPSKAAIINKMRWAIFERKLMRRDEAQAALFVPTSTNSASSSSSNSSFLLSSIRTCFPYYHSLSGCGGGDSSTTRTPAFLENAGGTQVPSMVIDAVCASLQNRHRAVFGANSKVAAKDTLLTLLGASSSTNYTISLGANATSLLISLANAYVKLGLLKPSDEIILKTDNHLANIQPWLDVAAQTGAVVKWWSSSSTSLSGGGGDDDLDILRKLVTTKTRIVAVPHASNVAGHINDLRRLGRLIKDCSNEYAHFVVDGVASVPHLFADLDSLKDVVDWYAISCHKFFGPHLGALCGSCRLDLVSSSSSTAAERSTNQITQLLEHGTISYEACAGINGLGTYFRHLALDAKRAQNAIDAPISDKVAVDILLQSHCQEEPLDEIDSPLDHKQVKIVYRMIARSERVLLRLMLEGMSRSPKVRVIWISDGAAATRGLTTTTRRLPIISFVHRTLSNQTIVEECAKKGVVTRCGTFLSSDAFQRELDIDPKTGVVRFSLVHYNSIEDVTHAIQVLEEIKDWF